MRTVAVRVQRRMEKIKNQGTKMNQTQITAAAALAGFAPEKECGITIRTLQRWAKDEKITTMTIGSRVYFHLETARRLASEMRDPGEGMVLISKLTSSTSLQRLMARECRAGTIKGRKISVDGKKGAWHADEASAKNWLARRAPRSSAMGATPVESKIGPVSAQVAGPAEVDPEVIDVVRSMLRAHDKRATVQHDEMLKLVTRAELVADRIDVALASFAAPVVNNVSNGHSKAPVASEFPEIKPTIDYPG